MKKISQRIKGNNNIQVAGDLINTEKIVHKTEVIHDNKFHITDEQAKEIRDRVHKIAKYRSNESKYSYPQAFNLLYDRFHITKYQLLPKEKYEEAIVFLNKQIAINRSKFKNVDNDQWRKDMNSAVQARAKKLGIDIHEFAYSALQLKNPITSITELSDTRIKKLYAKLFGVRPKSREI